MKIGSTIYLDHQATTPLDPRVFEEMEPWWKENMGNPHSVEHVVGWQASKAVDLARGQVAKLIGADSDEVIFTSGATESNNLALLGLSRRNSGRRRRILVSTIEHKCVLEASCALERIGNYTVDVVPVDDKGFVDFASLQRLVSDDVLFISIMAVNNEIGTIQDIKRIGKIASTNGIIFHCDAAQAPCAIDIDVFDGCIDLLSLSSHKMYGPKGIGALYIRREIQGKIEPLLYGGGQQNNLRSGTTPVPLCVGMGKAAELIFSGGIDKEREKLRQLSEQFIKGLRGRGWSLGLNGPLFPYRHPGNVNLRFNGFMGTEILGSLQPKLAASTGSACYSGTLGSSYVLKAIGMDDESAEASIRFSLGRFTDSEDIEEAVDLVDKALMQLQ